MQDILNGFSDVVEHYSIDESFLDMSEYEGDQMSLGKKMQMEILEETGLETSVGVSMSRILSKVAAKKGKPFGVTVVNKENLEDFSKSTVIGDVPGIGRKLNMRMENVGIKTVWDYVNKPSFFIKKILHKPGGGALV